MIRSDGNGGLIIPKGVFVLLGLIVSLISIIATVVAYGVSVKGEVERNTDVLSDIVPKVEECQIGRGITDVRLENIERDIGEIKDYLKVLAED